MPPWEWVCAVQSWLLGKGASRSETSRCRLCSTTGLCKHGGVSLCASPASCRNHLCVWVMQRKRKHLSKVSGCASPSSNCRRCLLRSCICVQMARAHFSAVAIQPCPDFLVVRSWPGPPTLGWNAVPGGHRAALCWECVSCLLGCSLPSAQGQGDPHCQSLPAPGEVAAVPGVSCLSHSVGPSLVSLLMGNSAE